MKQSASIDLLLNLVPERPDSVLEHLNAHPDLATKQDSHGYSLLHAAISYNHPDLARKLVRDFRVDINIKDEDGDPPLAAAETVDVARLLVEELGASLKTRNNDDQTPEEKIDSEEDYPLVAAYLRQAGGRGSGSAANAAESALDGTTDNGTTSNGVVHPPRVPPGISDIRIGTTQISEDDDSFAPDPEIRRRIEELAAREDFQSEQGQADLRDLVSEVVTGLRQDQQQQDRSSTRRRLD